MPSAEERLHQLAEQMRRSREDDDDGGGGNGSDAHRVLPAPSMPMEVAHIFLEHHATSDEGDLKIRHWRGGWWTWRTSHWVEVDERRMRSLLYRFTEHALFWKEDKNLLELVPWAPNRYKIANLLEALAAVVHLEADKDQPLWLDRRETGTIVATANGLLDIENRRLYPHTAKFFNNVAVPFDFDPGAPPPVNWLAFLARLWPKSESGGAERPEVLVLAEWFGYVISGRTDLHKIFMTVGPTRGGKGVTARVLGALVGEKNVAGPTLSSLGGEFGLAPLLGKTLAVIADARFVGKNGSVVVERLLSISGEDSLTVNRKFRDQWTGKLPCRFYIISNELPALGDASEAIIGRIILLPFRRSWFGKEDHGLENRLRTELPGILNFALDGLRRLTATNRFTRIPAADEAIVAMRDLASPVAAFVREQCMLPNEEERNMEVEVDTIFRAYKEWAELNGHPRITKQTFGRDLRAAVQSVRMRRPERTVEEPGSLPGIMTRRTVRIRVYTGIRLKTAAEEANA